MQQLCGKKSIINLCSNVGSNDWWLQDAQDQNLIFLWTLFYWHSLHVFVLEEPNNNYFIWGVARREGLTLVWDAYRTRWRTCGPTWHLFSFRCHMEGRLGSNLCTKESTWLGNQSEEDKTLNTSCNSSGNESRARLYLGITHIAAHLGCGWNKQIVISHLKWSRESFVKWFVLQIPTQTRAMSACRDPISRLVSLEWSL